MSPTNALPPDQQAVLALLLKQGRTYDDIAAMLRIDREAVRGRAFAAAEALVPEGGVDRDRRAQINDYLLGQQSASERQATRDALSVLAPERAWGRALVAELQPLSDTPLPEIPADEAEVAPVAPAPDPQRAAEHEQDRQSRLGMILLLGGLAAAIAVAVVLLVGGGSDDKTPTVVKPPPRHTTTATTTTPVTTPATGPSTTPTTTTPSTTPTTTSTTTSPTTTTTPTKINGLASVNLASPNGAKEPVGVAEILQLTTNTVGANIVARGLEPGGDAFAYAIWLTSKSGHDTFIGFGRTVKADGKLSVLGDLPQNAATYDLLVLTKETVASPSKPGTIVLQGTLPKSAIAKVTSASAGTSTSTTTTP